VLFISFLHEDFGCVYQANGQGMTEEEKMGKGVAKLTFLIKPLR